MTDLVVLATGNKAALRSCMGSNVLAMSLPAMEGCREEGIPYRLLEDFYGPSQWDNSIPEFTNQLESVLVDCDRQVGSVRGFHRSYSSNGFWFLHRLGNLHYLQKVAAAIKAEYDTVTLVVDTPIDELPVFNVSYSALVFQELGEGLPYALRVLRHGLNVDRVVVVGSDSGAIPKKRWAPAWMNESYASFFKRTPEIFYRRSMEVAKTLVRRMSAKRGRVLVVQGGYDVNALESCCSHVRFVKILPLVIAGLNRQRTAFPEQTDEGHAVLKSWTTFFEAHLPDFASWLEGMVSSYHRMIVARLPEVFREIEQQFDASRPSAVLYAMGAQTALQEAVAHVAVGKGVPVYYFKHGGPENLFVEFAPRDRYFERNPVISRYQYLHSDTELHWYENLPAVKPLVVGPLREIRCKGHAPGRRVLYSAGTPAHYTFKDMRMTVTDGERHEFATTLLALSVQNGVSLDIKVHPAEWRTGRDFFTMLVADQAAEGSARVLVGGSVERVLCNYGLLVLDILRTAVLSAALPLNIPIILFLPERTATDPDTLPDLEKRVYVVRTPEELEEHIARYVAGELESKWSEDFTRKYFGRIDTKQALAMVKQRICMFEGEA